jgi:hypothetical protein
MSGGSQYWQGAQSKAPVTFEQSDTYFPFPQLAPAHGFGSSASFPANNTTETSRIQILLPRSVISLGTKCKVHDTVQISWHIGPIRLQVALHSCINIARFHTPLQRLLWAPCTLLSSAPQDPVAVGLSVRYHLEASWSVLHSINVSSGLIR